MGEKTCLGNIPQTRILFGYQKLCCNKRRLQQLFHILKNLSKFVQNAVLPFFAIALISSTNAYIQTSELFEQDSNISTIELTPEKTFAKILNTFNILVIGYTISHLIPIMLTKRDKSILEKQDFEVWYDMQGFSDDNGLFYKLYKWIPPTIAPEDFTDNEFKNLCKTKEGITQLEQYRTSKGNPILFS